MRDEETALVNDQRGRCVGARNECAQRFIAPPNVILKQLGQSGHVMRIVERFD
jgi:hypothetical protein